MSDALVEQLLQAKLEIAKREEMITEVQNQLERIPENLELMRLGSGQSFGELALITSKPRSANIVCLEECHLAVMHKEDYERVLQKIELKVQTMKQDFLHQVPFLKRWSKKNL